MPTYNQDELDSMLATYSLEEAEMMAFLLEEEDDDMADDSGEPTSWSED